MPSLQKPKRLKPGDTLAVVSTSAPTVDPPNAFEQGIALLEAEGFRVKLMPHARDKAVYLAGSDAHRLADLHAAFQDPEVQGILCARGGYGAMRLLPHLDFELIRQHPKVFIGFSDITALHLAFSQQTGLVSFYGPMLTSNLIHGEPYSQSELFKLVCAKETFPYPVPNQDSYTCFHPGVAEGPLTGGNLSLLTALCGTPYQVQAQGKILFIEDWHEQFYTLDRQFQQLKLAGVFEGIRGLLLCDFSEIQPEKDYPLSDLLQHLTADLNVPAGYGFSIGHGAQTATLPIGTQARFDASTGCLELLEAPVA